MAPWRVGATGRPDGVSQDYRAVHGGRGREVGPGLRQCSGQPGGHGQAQAQRCADDIHPSAHGWQGHLLDRTRGARAVRGRVLVAFCPRWCSRAGWWSTIVGGAGCPAGRTSKAQAQMEAGPRALRPAGYRRQVRGAGEGRRWAPGGAGPRPAPSAPGRGGGEEEEEEEEEAPAPGDLAPRACPRPTLREAP